jgi:hypothetical protein
MTRFLSDALQAGEPSFRMGLQRLESANGNPSHDIRFSAAVNNATKAKIQELGLDPSDTTPTELYHALQERVKADDTRLTRRLQTLAATHVSAEAQVADGMVHALRQLSHERQCFALKTSVLRSLLRKQPPKRAMKQLGYRSLDSFLKHEHPMLVVSAAWLSESQRWQQRFTEQYKQLTSADFEEREVTVLQPQAERWHTLASSVVAEKRHNLLSFKELGALVLLPLPDHAPAGSTTVSMSLALHELNEIWASSTFLKLSQVRPDFGATIKMVASEEPHLSSQLLDRPVPWHLIQRYYARMRHAMSADIFEPYVHLDDLSWQPVEQLLAKLEPSFSFWQQTAHLGTMHNRQPVSMNLIDTALGYCNQLPFEQRMSGYFQHSLWHELLLRYFKHGTVEQTVLHELQPQLATESVTIA